MLPRAARCAVRGFGAQRDGTAERAAAAPSPPCPARVGRLSPALIGTVGVWLPLRPREALPERGEEHRGVLAVLLQETAERARVVPLLILTVEYAGPVAHGGIPLGLLAL